MKKSLRKKICLIGSCLIGMFVVLNIIFTFFWMSPVATQIFIRKMGKLAVSIEKKYEVLEEEDFQLYIEQMNEDYNTKIIVFNEKKEVVTATFRYKSSSANEYLSERVTNENINTLDSKKMISLSEKDSKKEMVRMYVVRKIAPNRYVLLSRSVRSLQNATDSAIIFDIITGIFIIIIGFFVVLRLSKSLVDPINEIKNAAEHISNLEFDTKVQKIGEDELGQLGMSINRMSEHLENSVNQLQMDIDNRKRLVRNLSHEIKSPVAVIMGYADRMKAILEKNPEKAAVYCEIISNESSRIDVLVKEMLEVSKLEQSVEMIQPATFCVRQLFEKIYIRVKEEYMEKNISLSIECDESDKIVADYGLIELAVYNLVNNGISHTIQEEINILVSGKWENDGYQIRVHNTGSHIPEDELESIWEAFYKVDKARSRNKKGCGVGLSIVREIVEAHQGTYEAGNDETGVYFVITLPGIIEKIS